MKHTSVAAVRLIPPLRHVHIQPRQPTGHHQLEYPNPSSPAALLGIGACQREPSLPVVFAGRLGWQGIEKAVDLLQLENIFPPMTLFRYLHESYVRAALVSLPYFDEPDMLSAMPRRHIVIVRAVDGENWNMSEIRGVQVVVVRRQRRFEYTHQRGIGEMIGSQTVWNVVLDREPPRSGDDYG